MQFNTSYINVNNVWRELLIIFDTKEIPEFENGVITEKCGDYETIYDTDGLYQSKKDGDTYYNWYLINSTVVKETGVETLKQEVSELKTTNADFAQVILDMQYQNALNKIGG